MIIPQMDGGLIPHVNLHDELVSLDALLSQLKEQCAIPQ
jgi:hypothetical protein